MPYILMHSRGGPEEFHHPQHKVYGSLEAEIAAEISKSADAAMQAGVPAWRLMLDPGIGFSKGPADSMKLVTSSAAIRQHLPGTCCASCMATTITFVYSSVLCQWTLSWTLVVWVW